MMQLLPLMKMLAFLVRWDYTSHLEACKGVLEFEWQEPPKVGRPSSVLCITLMATTLLSSKSQLHAPQWQICSVVPSAAL